MDPDRHGAFWPQEECVKVGWHAPAPGTRTGVADYAQTLLAALRRSGVGIVESGPGARDADIQIYHLGNNRLHREIYAHALEVPGVVVLHDAVLHHLLLGTLTREEYLAEWVLNYSEWRRDLGAELWSGRGGSAVDPRYFRFPMLRRIVERSRAVIVHNPGAAEMAREHGAKHVFTIPHFCDLRDVPEPGDAARFRERIGVGQATTVFGIFGYLRETKRVLTCIAAFRKLHAVLPDTALLLAGEVVSQDLARLLEIEANHSRIHRMGRLSEREFGLAAAAVDCCLNLRYPGAGESSGIAVRLMGMGKPVILTCNEENSALPREAVIRVTPGIAETAELVDHMILVTAFPAIAGAIGNEAQRHIRTHHSLETVTRQYWETLCAPGL